MEVAPGLLQLEDVTKAQGNFKRDIMEVAKEHLHNNLAYVRQEKERLDLGDFDTHYKTNTSEQ